ncbi:hypothetical protein LTR66_011144 [Elasticomyces elasticus]|nr:hypothetical protein LTR66_011144 [Elasticomyces elasticus]
MSLFITNPSFVPEDVDVRDDCGDEMVSVVSALDDRGGDEVRDGTLDGVKEPVQHKDAGAVPVQASASEGAQSAVAVSESSDGISDARESSNVTPDAAREEVVQAVETPPRDEERTGIGDGLRKPLRDVSHGRGTDGREEDVYALHEDTSDSRDAKVSPIHSRHVSQVSCLEPTQSEDGLLATQRPITPSNNNDSFLQHAIAQARPDERPQQTLPPLTSRFTNRQYGRPDLRGERPMSYALMPREVNGTVVDDSLNTPARVGTDSATRYQSGLRGPYVGDLERAAVGGYPVEPEGQRSRYSLPNDQVAEFDARYSRQHTLSPPPGAEYSLRDVRSPEFTARTIDPRHHGTGYQLPGVGPPADGLSTGRPARHSALLGGSDARETAERVVENGRMYPQYMADEADTIVSHPASARPEKTNQPVETAERRSGLWNLSAQPPPVTPAPAARAGDKPASRPGTLQLLQRSSTSSANADVPQKRRFSGLGSLFGRSKSGTTGHGTPKSSKLQKAEPARSQQRRVMEQRAGDLGSRLADETAKRQQYAAVPRPQPQHLYSGRSAQNADRDAEDTTGVSPPPGGWYAPQLPVATPQSMDASQQEVPGYSQSYAPSRTQTPSVPLQPINMIQKRTSSYGEAYVPVPEAFQPTRAAFAPRNRYEAQDVDFMDQAPQRPQLLYRVSSGQHRQQQQKRPGQQHPDPYGDPQAQHMRPVSPPSVLDRLSPQISRDEQFPDYRSHGSSPSFSSVQSRVVPGGYPPPRVPARINSLGEEIARSPVHHRPGYTNVRQKAPWMGPMSGGQFRGYQTEAPQDAAAGYHGRDGQHRMRHMHPDPRDRALSPQQQHALPVSSAPSRFYHNADPVDRPPIPPPKTPLHVDAGAQHDAAAGRGAYSSSPPSFANRAAMHTHPHVYAQSMGRQPQPQSYTYSSPPPPQSTTHSQDQNQYQTYPLPPPKPHAREESEERVEMRGASYPGQEWTPDGLRGAGWE